MGNAFVIMKFGDADLDRVYDEIIKPTLVACGLVSKRVDKDNGGDMVKKEIDAFIEEADIIVADVTGERPNCYCEIGYAMGLKKITNLILTAREDHNPDSSGYKPGGPKVHFDLTNYPFIFWSPGTPDRFRADLEAEIKRRQHCLAQRPQLVAEPWDHEWIKHEQGIAEKAFQRAGKTGFMEVWFALPQPKPQFTIKELRAAAHASQIDAFGWPIGIFFDDVERAPKILKDGIRAEVVVEPIIPLPSDHPDNGKSTFTVDCWMLRKNGDFFLRKSLFEDERVAERVYSDIRIVRVVEALLYCRRVYSQLGVSKEAKAHVRIAHGGLQGRRLTNSNAYLLGSPSLPAEEKDIDASISFPLNPDSSDMVMAVQTLLAPLFELFGRDLGNDTYTAIVDGFLKKVQSL